MLPNLINWAQFVHFNIIFFCTCREEIQWEDWQQHRLHHRWWRACWPEWEYILDWRFQLMHCWNLKRGHIKLFPHIGLQTRLVPEMQRFLNRVKCQIFTHHWLAAPVSMVISSPNTTGKEQNRLPLFSFPSPLIFLSSSSSSPSSSSLVCLSSSDGSRTIAAARAQKTSSPPDTMKGKGNPPQSNRMPPVKK